MRLLGGALVVLIAVLGWWLQTGPDGSDDESRTPGDASTTYLGSYEQLDSGDAPASEVPAPSAEADEQRLGTDPESGLAWVDVADLPAEAEETLRLIDDGGPFPYERDGVTFGNFEGLLPQRARGYYAEYTVPTPGLSHRGARRIVAGDGDEYYWTEDHYESFERIVR
ncbi:ribonuclease domain-containing protein [Nocardioides dubius]